MSQGPSLDGRCCRAQANAAVAPGKKWDFRILPSPRAFYTHLFDRGISFSPVCFPLVPVFVIPDGENALGPFESSVERVPASISDSSAPPSSSLYGDVNIPFRVQLWKKNSELKTLWSSFLFPLSALLVFFLLGKLSPESLVFPRPHFSVQRKAGSVFFFRPPLACSVQDSPDASFFDFLLIPKLGSPLFLFWSHFGSEFLELLNVYHSFSFPFHPSPSKRYF